LVRRATASANGDWNSAALAAAQAVQAQLRDR